MQVRSISELAGSVSLMCCCRALVDVQNIFGCACQGYENILWKYAALMGFSSEWISTFRRHRFQFFTCSAPLRCICKASHDVKLPSRAPQDVTKDAFIAMRNCSTYYAKRTNSVFHDCVSKVFPRCGCKFQAVNQVVAC